MDNFKYQVKSMKTYAYSTPVAVLASLEKYPGSKNYKHQSTDILLSICCELYLQLDVVMVLKKHQIEYEGCV